MLKEIKKLVVTVIYHAQLAGLHVPNLRNPFKAKRDMAYWDKFMADNGMMLSSAVQQKAQGLAGIIIFEDGEVPNAFLAELLITQLIQEHECPAHIAEKLAMRAYAVNTFH